MPVNFSQHIGGILVFPTKEEYEQFVNRVVTAIEVRRREYEKNKLPWAFRGHVRIEVLDEAGTKQFAADMESRPLRGYAAYLDPDAIRLCSETGIDCPVSKQPHKAKPDYVRVAIELDCWFRDPST
jgi:hypothetical protein